ncbi:MAG: DNA-binding protein [Thermoplasmata archaeon]|nr:MAG: DNA-binding protein [Thermoplasmata archaeon]
MYKTKSELYELVKDLMNQDDFEKEIEKRFHEYEGLLNEDAIAYLIVDEKGKNVMDMATISELKDGDSVSLEVHVEDIKEPREFKRKNGSLGQVANLIVADETAMCRLTLWDKDVETVKDGTIKKDSKIRIVNGYVKVSSFGMEINIGKWGLFFID